MTTPSGTLPVDEPPLALWHQKHTFHPGERVHFRSHEEIDAGLEDGYLELELLFEGLHNASQHRVIRKIKSVETGSYLATENNIGEHKNESRSFFNTLEELLRKIDLHAYKWYPLYGEGHFPTLSEVGALYQQMADLLDEKEAGI